MVRLVPYTCALHRFSVANSNMAHWVAKRQGKITPIFVKGEKGEPPGPRGSGCEAVFFLNCLAGSMELRENYGFLRRQIRHILGVLMDHLEELCHAWEQIHGIA